MTARLGQVLYWFGCLAAGLCVAGGAAMAIIMQQSHNAADVASANIMGAVIAAMGIIPWLIGRACKYVLTGE